MEIKSESFEEKIAREQKEQKEYKEKVEGLVRQVCKILNFRPQNDKDDSWSYVRLNARAGNESLHFSSGTYHMKDRIQISGNFPRTETGELIDPYRYGEKHHEITVSIAKTPEQIAKDIERRFLPRYRELLKIVQERVEKSNQYRRTSLENLEEIKGKRLTEEERKRLLIRLDGAIFGEVAVSDDSAKLELHSVPIKTAKKITELCAEVGRREKD